MHWINKSSIIEHGIKHLTFEIHHMTAHNKEDEIQISLYYNQLTLKVQNLSASSGIRSPHHFQNTC